MTTKAPSREAVAVMAAWPTDDGEWITEEEVAMGLAAAGVGTGPRSLVSVLGEARRRSWLLRDQKQEPVLYLRTVSGREAAATLVPHPA